MTGLTLVIADRDDDCVEALSDYFTSFRKSDFSRVVGFTQKDNLCKFINENEVDILLISLDIYGNGLEFEDINTIVLLNEGVIPKIYEGMNLVIKNSPASEIATYILKCYAKENKDKKVIVQDNSKCSVVSVY